MRKTAEYMAPLVMLRKMEGKTMANVADRVGCSISMISNLESGLTFRIDLIERYAEMFGKQVRIDYVDATD